MPPMVVAPAFSLRVTRALQEQPGHIVWGNPSSKIIKCSGATGPSKRSPQNVVHSHFSVSAPLKSSDCSAEIISDLLRCSRNWLADRVFGGPKLAIRREDDGLNDKCNDV